LRGLQVYCSLQCLYPFLDHVYAVTHSKTVSAENFVRNYDYDGYGDDNVDGGSDVDVDDDDDDDDNNNNNNNVFGTNLTYTYNDCRCTLNYIQIFKLLVIISL
jgi:hypothetical protein